MSSTYAKTHLNALLAESQPRKTVTITSHGKPVATLAPVTGPPPPGLVSCPELGPITADFDERSPMTSWTPGRAARDWRTE